MFWYMVMAYLKVSSQPLPTETKENQNQSYQEFG